MSLAPAEIDAGSDVVLLAEEATAVAEALLADAIAEVRARVTVDGRTVGRMLDREQRAAHGLAWLATYVQVLRQLAAYAARARAAGRLGEIEELIVRIGLGEYFAQILGGIPMSQGEIVRLADLGIAADKVAARVRPGCEAATAAGNSAGNRARLIELMRARQAAATMGDCLLDDTLDQIRDEMRRFADSEVAPNAHKWHRTNSYIPLETIAHMGELGVFGLTLP